MELICREYYADRNLLDGDTLNRELFSDDKQCKIPEIQALVSRFALYLQLIAGVLGAITSPILGAYSDRHGRRIVMAISSFGLLASEIVSILAVKYPHVFSVNFLLVGAFVDGLTGSFMVGMAIAHSYVADCTSMEKRAVHFGYIVGGLYLGIAVGPALGGLLIKATGNPLHVFYAALVAHGLFIVYIAAILPESLTPSRMRLAQEKYDHQQSLRDNEGPRGYFQQLKSWNPLQPLTILFPTGPGSSPRLRTNLIVLAAVDTLFVGVGMGAMTVTIIYAEMAFNWGNYESSIYVSFVNSARVIVLFAIMPLLVKAVNAVSRRRQTVDTSPHEHEADSQDLKHSGASTLDIVSIRLAIFIELVGYLCYAAAMNGAEFTLAGIITALGGVGSPTVQSALTKHVPQDKTGQLLGASALLRSLARVFFPTLFNLVYAETVGTFPQTVFVCLASVFLLSAVCSMFITPHVKLHEDKHGNVVDGEHVSSMSTPTSPTASSSVTGSATV